MSEPIRLTRRGELVFGILSAVTALIVFPVSAFLVIALVVAR